MPEADVVLDALATALADAFGEGEGPYWVWHLGQLSDGGQNYRVQLIRIPQGDHAEMEVSRELALDRQHALDWLTEDLVWHLRYRLAPSLAGGL